MRKLQKVAVVAAMLGGVSFIGAGTASAAGGSDGSDIDIRQTSSCSTHDLNVDILGNAQVLADILRNLLLGEGDTTQSTRIGSSLDCSNKAG